MNRRQLAILALAALLAISAALIVSTRRNSTHDSSGAALVPALAGELDTVTALSVRKGGPAANVTVHRTGDKWTVAQRADYPADVGKLRTLLLALSEARIREEKTADPANFQIIGVEDPTKPGASGAELELLAKDGKHVIIVGKPIAEGNFVRRGGENISYLVEPGISVEAEPRFWIDAHLLDLSLAKVQSIAVKPATGPAYTVRRAPAPAPVSTTAAASAVGPPAAAPAAAVPGPFLLDAVPSGRKAADTALLAPTPTAFNLSAEDVAAAGDIDFNAPASATVVLTDGSSVTFTGAVVGDKHWVQIAAPKDAALNAKANGRAFEVAGYRYDAIFRPLEQLLVPKEPPPAPKKPAPAAKAPQGIAPKP